MDTNARRHASRWLAIPTLLAALLVAACGTGAGDLGPVATPPPAPGGSLDAPSAEPTPGTTAGAASASPGSSSGSSQAPTTTVRAYFFLGSFTGNAGLVPVLREIPRTPAVGAAALDALIQGPNERELSASPAMYSYVPAGAKVLKLAISNGRATVLLSQEWAAGGTKDSFIGRNAQLVYTLTQFPTVTSVDVQVEGQSSSTEGGIDLAMTRESTATGALAAIFVDSPAWGGVLANPARVTGLANVFEAAFRIQVLDGAGHSLADIPAMATCGTGCWGTFDVAVRYSVGSAQWGTLRVYDRSAKDGSKEHVVDYPVWLTPS